MSGLSLIVASKRGMGVSVGMARATALVRRVVASANPKMQCFKVFIVALLSRATDTRARHKLGAPALLPSRALAQEGDHGLAQRVDHARAGEHRAHASRA